MESREFILIQGYVESEPAARKFEGLNVRLAAHADYSLHNVAKLDLSCNDPA